jgi:hypothetical protein
MWVVSLLSKNNAVVGTHIDVQRKTKGDTEKERRGREGGRGKVREKGERRITLVPAT